MEDDEMHRQLQTVSAACQQSSTAACFFFLLLLAAVIVITSRRFIVVKLFQARGRRTTTRRKKDHDRRRPPPPPGRGSSWWWSVVETLAFVSANSSGRYGGPCFRTTLFSTTHVFVSSPDAARALLADSAGEHSSGFSKRYVRSVAELLGEHSLLCAAGSHRALRRAVAPLFNAQATASLAANFDALTRSRIKTGGTSTRTVMVVLDAALDVTFEAICDMLIGTQQPEVKRRLQRDVAAVTRAMLALPLRWVPGTRFHAGLRARKRIMDLLSQEIASRQRHIIMDHSSNCKHEHEHEHDDFLQSLLLLRSRRQQSPSSSSNGGDDDLLLTDDQILDNILTLIIAGQVTTASAITWMVKYLADNKDFQETLRSVQLELALKHKTDGDAPLTLQQLNSMELAYMTVKESLRMASIVSWFPRVALEDCQVAGFHINKGWIVNIDARALHYDATLYDNPTTFDPLRFKGKNMCSKQQAPYSFLVFGAGGRTCLGMNLAKIMMLIFLHHLVTNWRWEMADDDPSLEKWAMFPRLKSGCPVHLTPI